MKTTISQKFRIDAGHRVFGHEGKCKNIHGHSYEIVFTFTAHKLDSLGRIIDFGLIKISIGGWLDEFWDHGTILWEKDPALVLWQENTWLGKFYCLPDNPTAENLAAHLFQVFTKRAFAGVTLISVKCQETPNCCADVYKEI